jgi:integrase
VQGVLNGATIRRSLDLTNWEAANRRIRELEIHGDVNVVSVCDAADRFIADRESMHLSSAMMSKYRNVVGELKTEFGDRSLRSITVDDIRKIRERWKLAAITSQKRLEMIRKFFSFCVDSDWLEKNLAQKVKAPAAKFEPTLPFTEGEMKRILRAAENAKKNHPKMPADAPKKLKALILLMRYSGLRISDAVMFRKDSLTNGKLFLRQEKTKELVSLPMPPFVIDAVMACDEGREYFFYTGEGLPKTAVTDWQWRLRKIYDDAGIPDGHSHRLRDTFSVDLLSHGVPLEIVSKLLGHTSIKTTEKHYAPWVKSRNDALEAAVKGTWGS